jgi:hypothetical protein
MEKVVNLLDPIISVFSKSLIETVGANLTVFVDIGLRGCRTHDLACLNFLLLVDNYCCELLKGLANVDVYYYYYPQFVIHFAGDRSNHSSH